MKADCGKAIAKARKAKNLTQAALGERAGVAQNTISNIEGGKVKGGLKASDAIRISKALEEPEVVVAYCQSCPVRPLLFPDGLEVDPAEVLEKLRAELETAAALTADLTSKLSDPSFRSSPEFLQGVSKVRSITSSLSAVQQGLDAGCLSRCVHE